MSQTSYSIYIPAVSYPGQIADSDRVQDILSAAAVAAPLPYGVLVVSDSSNGLGFDQLAARLPAASSDITTLGLPLGVVVADQARAQNPSFTVPTYPQYSAVPCCRKGRIWVLAETAMTDGVAPYVRFTANSSFTPGTPGAFGNSADSDKAVQLTEQQGVVRGTTSAAGYAVISLDLN